MNRAIAWLAALALAAGCVVAFDDLVLVVIGAAGCAVLVAISVADLERRIVPNRIVVPALVGALVAQTVRDPSLEWILAALAAGGFFFVFALVYPAGLGMGDVKLAAFLGAWLGWTVFVGLFVGTVLAMLPAVAILVAKGSAGRKIGIPFAPFLAAGGIVALFAGDAVLDWWLGS